MLLFGVLLIVDAEAGFAKTLVATGGLVGSADRLRAGPVGRDEDSTELLRARSFARGRVGDARRIGALPLFGEGNVDADACEIGTRFAGLRFGSSIACRGSLNAPTLGPAFPGSEVVDCLEGE